MSKPTKKFAPGVHERAVRLVLDHEAEHPSRWRVIVWISTKIGCSVHSLGAWLKKAVAQGSPAPGGRAPTYDGDDLPEPNGLDPNLTLGHYPHGIGVVLGQPGDKLEWNVGDRSQAASYSAMSY